MGKFKDILEKVGKHREDERRRHEELHRIHEEHDREHRELHRKQRELERRFRAAYKSGMDPQKMREEYEELREDFHRKKYELHKRYSQMQRNKAEYHRLHRHARVSPVIILILNIVIWVLVYKYVGLKNIGVFFAILISLGGAFEFFFLRKIESRILTPIDKLKKGVEEISKGNYDVKLDSNVRSEIGVLIDSFNEMAQKLQESEKVKNEYEENRRSLIANISHDLKTPITSIQGYIEAITDGNAVSPENINKYLKIIYNNTAYMNKLIDDLFLFSKLDMQKLEFNFESIPVRPYVSDLIEEFKLELEERNVKFEYIDNMETECSFNVDRKRIHQVFRNIIGNAVKYGPEQELSISTELYKLDDFIYIDIKDNGPGIPEDKLEHIFERFYRIDAERTKDFMSTGLGLAISKELVEAHGGSITAISVEHDGTRFTVRLPVLQ
jgi:signal transduction histidine kinase